MRNTKHHTAIITVLSAAPALLAGDPLIITSFPVTYLLQPAESHVPITVEVELITTRRPPTIFYRCGADLDADADVDSSDLNILLSGFATSAVGDLDFDGDTDSLDLNLMLATFGAVCTPP